MTKVPVLVLVVEVKDRVEVNRAKPSQRIGNICQTMTKRRTT